MRTTATSISAAIAGIVSRKAKHGNLTSRKSRCAKVVRPASRAGEADQNRPVSGYEAASRREMSIQKALLVDDSKSARFFLRNLLQKNGVEVDMVDSGEAALEYLKEHRPNLIFMDHLMPGIDGFETTCMRACARLIPFMPGKVRGCRKLSKIPSSRGWGDGLKE